MQSTVLFMNGLEQELKTSSNMKEKTCFDKLKIPEGFEKTAGLKFHILQQITAPHTKHEKIGPPYFRT